MQFYCQTIVFGHFINGRDLRNRYSSRACPRNINMEKKPQHTPGCKLGLTRGSVPHSLFFPPSPGQAERDHGSQRPVLSHIGLKAVSCSCSADISCISALNRWQQGLAALTAVPLTKREGWRSMTKIQGYLVERGELVLSQLHLSGSDPAVDVLHPATPGPAAPDRAMTAGPVLLPLPLLPFLLLWRPDI